VHDRGVDVRDSTAYGVEVVTRQGVPADVDAVLDRVAEAVLDDRRWSPSR